MMASNESPTVSVQSSTTSSSKTQKETPPIYPSAMPPPTAIETPLSSKKGT